MDHRTPVIDTPQYTIYEQRSLGAVWMHCDVREWSASTAREMAKAASRLGSTYTEPLFAINQPHNCAKHQKFLRLMGFDFFKTLPTKDGGEAHVFKWVRHGV